MEELQPHSKLKGLKMLGYRGVKLPDWAIDNNMVKSLPYLVKLHLEDCKDLEQVPRIGKLQNLKVLSLLSLEKLEYIEEDNPQASVSGLLTAEEPLYFPSLEQLWLKNLPKSKGWMKSGMEVGDVRLSQLKSLVIDICPELTWIPLSPILEDLTSIDPGSSSNSYSSNVLILRAVESDNVPWLNSLLVEAFQCLFELRIKYDKEVESLAEFGVILHSCSSSLRSLIIHDCHKLKTLYGGLEHLTALEKLRISTSHNLRLSEEVTQNSTGTPWPSLHQSLCYLHLWTHRSS
uniref:R13L1/DRL21-like LRR repeat region domain-containing protein n=1 Tax=Chenopodium quinoa TaxID=63459 RepID=A0A803MLP6_CHEQI